MIKIVDKKISLIVYILNLVLVSQITFIKICIGKIIKLT